MQCMEPAGYKSWDAANNTVEKSSLQKRLQTSPLVISLMCTESDNAPAESSAQRYVVMGMQD